MNPRRVVSLVPSLTETLFDLGAGPLVVGATDFCVFPATMNVARVGGTKNPDIDRIRELRPDLVHMNLEENLRQHAEKIGELAALHVTEPKSVDDVRTLIVELGALYGRSERAGELADALTKARHSLPKRNFTFAVAIWKKPWMWCGGDTYVSSLVGTAGGENVLQHRDRYPTMDLDCMASLEPQVIFLPDEPYVFSEADAREVREKTGARIVGPFPGHLFTWHGSRTILGLEFLRSSL